MALVRRKLALNWKTKPSWNRNNPAHARGSHPALEHAYGTLGCKLACGHPPCAEGERQHACVYLRDPSSAGIDGEASISTQKACWH